MIMHGKHGVYVIMRGNAWDVNTGISLAAVKISQSNKQAH